MNYISVALLMFLVLLTGCAAQHPAIVTPPVPAPVFEDAWVNRVEAGTSCSELTVYHADYVEHPGLYSESAAKYVNSRFIKCQKIEREMKYVERLMNAAWAVKVTYFSETAGKEWWFRKEEWVRLNDAYRGILTYSCPDGWTLHDQTCWAFRPLTEANMAMELKDGAQCYFDLGDETQCLCEQPAKTPF